MHFSGSGFEGTGTLQGMNDRRPGRDTRREPVNRTQALVLLFFALIWIALMVVSLLVPDLYASALRIGSSDSQAITLFLLALYLFIALLAVGVLRKWRWVFWLILVAFAFGILRPPVAVLQLAGLMDLEGPRWYAVLQAILGLLQFAIALAMVAGFRRGGVWAAF